MILASSAMHRTGGRFHALGRNVLLKNFAETSRLFQMAFFVVVARRFGAATLGDLTVLLMIGSVVILIFGDLGLNTTVIARMSAVPSPERESIASAGLFWKGVLTVISILLMSGSMRFAVSFGGWQEIVAVTVISCGSLWHEFLVALTNGVNRLDAEAWLRLVYRGVVYGGGSLLCLVCGLNAVLAYMAVVSVSVLGLTLVLFQKSIVRLRFLSLREINAGLLGESAPVWVTQVAQLTYLKLDLVVLGLLHIAAQLTGWYAAAWKIVDVLTAVPALLAAAALPLISGALPETDASAIASGYLKCMYVLPFIFVLPLAIGADWISRTLYGSGFAGTPAVLRVLVWALAPICVHSFLATLAVAKRRQAVAAKLGAATAVLGLLSALILVPHFGYVSMAFISLAANCLFAAIMVREFRDITGSMHLATCFKSLGSALAVFGCSLMFASEARPLFLAIAGLAVYGLALLLTGVVTVRDLGRGWRLAGSLLWNRPTQRVGVA